MNAWILAPLPIANAVASATAAGFSIVNVANDFAGVVWQSNGEAAPAFYVDLGSDQPVDTAMLFGLYGGVGALNTMTVQVATSAQGPGFLAGAYTDFVVGAVPVLAGANRLAGAKGVALVSRTGTISGRYVRFGFSALTGAIQIGRVVVGQRIVLERNFSFGGAFGIRDFGSLELSNRAVLLRRRAPKRRTVGISFSAARRDEVEATIMPLVEQLGGTDCMALVTDPAPDPMRERRCYFGPLTGELGAIWRNAAAWEWRVNLLSLF